MTIAATAADTPGDLFVDVGANVGSYAVWAAELGTARFTTSSESAIVEGVITIQEKTTRSVET